VDSDDISKYLDVVLERVQKQMNGARWMLRSYTSLKEETSSEDEALACLTAAIHENQNKEDFPVCKWPQADTSHQGRYDIESVRVSELMEINIFSTSEDDMVELVAKLMSWKDISYMPVEDDDGHLIGLVGANMLLDALATHRQKNSDTSLLVRDVMIKDPVTVAPDLFIKDAALEMKKHNIGCIPVTKENELLGIITKDHIADLTARLLQRS